MREANFIVIFMGAINAGGCDFSSFEAMASAGSKKRQKSIPLTPFSALIFHPLTAVDADGVN
jgi:hypothetical protein